MTKALKLVAAVALVSVFMSGCSVFGNKALQTKTKEYNADQLARIPEVGDSFDRARKARTASGLPYISGKAIPKAHHSLPQPFYMTYSIGIDKNQSLASIAGEITRLSGIPVRISSDVTNQQTLGGNSSTAVSQLTQNVWGVDAPVDYSNATLSDIMNGVCSRLGVDWDYDDVSGVINISRLTTRVFYVPIPTTASTQTSSVGISGTTGGANGTSATTSASTSTVNSTIDPWAGMQQLISGMLTPQGKVTVNASMNTVVVTDVKQSVERISLVVARFVKQSTQSMLFKVDVIGVVSNDQNQVGINWNLVYNQLGVMAPNANISFAGANPAVNAASGNLGFTLNPPTGGVPGHWDGTKLILSALDTVGKTSVVNSTFVPATNNKLASMAINNQVNYISSTTASAGGAVAGGAGGAPGLNASTVTTGFVLNMLPLTTDSGDIMLQFSMSNTVLNRMDVLSSAGQTVQQPNVSGTQMAFNQRLREGATTVLSGYTRMTNINVKNSMVPDVSIGGDHTVSQVQENMLILITPVAIN